jgi:hypothetical protein
LPDDEKAWVYSDVLIPYDQVVLIDELGDDVFSAPQIFVAEWPERVYGRVWVQSVYGTERTIELNEDAKHSRLERFDAQLRTLPRYTGY